MLLGAAGAAVLECSGATVVAGGASVVAAGALLGCDSGAGDGVVANGLGAAVSTRSFVRFPDFSEVVVCCCVEEVLRTGCEVEIVVTAANFIVVVDVDENGWGVVLTCCC